MSPLVSVWDLAAPPSDVWSVLHDVEGWPRWWPGLSAAQVVRPARDGDVGLRVHLVVASPLGYRLSFGTEITAVDPPGWAEARVVGDLRGTGRWELAPADLGTRATITWDVHLTRGWMRTVEPAAGPAFRRAHAVVMAGGEGGLRRELSRS